MGCDVMSHADDELYDMPVIGDSKTSQEEKVRC